MTLYDKRLGSFLSIHPTAYKGDPPKFSASVPPCGILHEDGVESGVLAGTMLRR
jgi:hypothetical protein